MIIAGHASLVNGKVYEAPTNTLVEILKKKDKEFVYLRHSIDGQLPSVAYWYKGGAMRQRTILPKGLPSIIRYGGEILVTFFYLLFSPKVWKGSYIGVDPLNAFTGILLRKIGVFNHTIFFTADYSTSRFKSRLLNDAYHFLDRFCVRNADQVWNVSSRILAVRKKMGLSTSKNIFVPNVPSDDYKKFVKNVKEENTIVTLGMISEQLDFINLFQALKALAAKNPNIRLKIIGNGPKEDEYKALVKKLGLDEKVSFLGYMSHDDALNEISKSGIGLALYNGNWSFNYYGDSMKCREYFCYGLPVVTTDTHSTVEDIKNNKAGEVCEISAHAYQEAIENILANYQAYSKNSFQLSGQYEGIHARLLSKLY